MTAKVLVKTLGLQSSQARILEAEMGGNAKVFAELERARLFATHAIAQGAIADRREQGWRDIIVDLAHADNQEVEARVDKLIPRLEELIGEMPGNQRNQLMDEILTVRCDYGRNLTTWAYLLGLAVGQQLGPDAFKTGGER